MHFSIPLLLAGATAVVADHSYYLGNGQYDQAAQERDATCDVRTANVNVLLQSY